MSRLRRHRWTEEQLRDAVRHSRSFRQTLLALGLAGEGGNYAVVQYWIRMYGIDTTHFSGRGWRRGVDTPVIPARPLEEILQKRSRYVSYKLKRRLFRAELKQPKCELCGWAEQASDGRIPVELDHINGDRFDNSIDNLRILCPNCHSLQSTHRGKNIGKHEKPGWWNGQTRNA